MAITKIQSESLNLADDFAFTGTITGAGEANTPYWFARSNAETSLANGSNTKVQYNISVLDSNSGLDTSTNYRYTIQSGDAGLYYIHGQYRVSSSSDYDNLQILLYKNGSQVANANLAHHHYETRVIQAILDLAENDYIEIYAYQGSGSSLNCNSDTNSNYFFGYKVANT